MEENKKPENPSIQQGWTLRDEFANSAMQGICVNAGRNRFDLDNGKEIATKAYEIADAMLKQREL